MNTTFCDYLPGHRVAGAVAAACLFLTCESTWGLGLAGDTIQGNLIIPWAPTAGNYWTENAEGYATSGLPIYVIVGSGTEFAINQQSGTESWQLTADVSDNQIAINESLSDSNPGWWLGEFTSWTMIFTDLDWAGAPGIGSIDYVAHDSNISLTSFDAHSAQFSINELVVYPTGPFSISWTTIVQLTPIPEPSSGGLLLGCMTVYLLRRSRLA